MHPSLCTLIDVFFAPHHLELSKYTEDAESKAYEGCSFIVGQKTVIYRKAKQTPKKVGQFVTFWKREGTAPIDYYIIYASNETETGVFVFTKDRLRDKAIVSTAHKEGKRGFRVYPHWDVPMSKQALATQKWQVPHFYKLDNASDLNKLAHLF
jgi:hypothetical protein